MSDGLRSMIHDILNLREEFSDKKDHNNIYTGVRIIDQKGKSFHFVGDFNLEIIKNEIVCRTCVKEGVQD